MRLIQLKLVAIVCTYYEFEKSRRRVTHPLEQCSTKEFRRLEHDMSDVANEDFAAPNSKQEGQK